MTARAVPEQPSRGELETSARVARVIVEDAFGERLRGLLARAGAKPTDVARLLGARREDLYEVFDGQRHMRAAWLELLPPAVERLYLEERAAAHGLELCEVAHEDGPRALTDVVRELSEVMTTAAVAEADGHISVEEAERELAEWADVERVMGARRARLRLAIERRGLAVAGGRP